MHTNTIWPFSYLIFNIVTSYNESILLLCIYKEKIFLNNDNKKKRNNKNKHDKEQKKGYD